ncbi:hypothetical protein [Streptomyces sp. KL116D]|uniref:hypothetical protein n=1 Tax=Streptomyces sp. KL116D TaxID=3045152 RepID=UPI003556FB0F
MNSAAEAPLTCEVAWITPCSTGLVAADMKVKWAGFGSQSVPHSASVSVPLMCSRADARSSARSGREISSASQL